MATLLAHTDLVLLEPCATHMHTVDKYRTSVDTAIDLMVHGARWAWAWHAAASAGASASRSGRRRLARVAIVEDVPQQFRGDTEAGPGAYGGWFKKSFAAKNPGCIHSPYNATALVRSRAQQLDLRAHVASVLARDAVRLGGVMPSHAAATPPVESAATSTAEHAKDTGARAPPTLASLLTPHVVPISAAMAPLGFMSKCGGRHGATMMGPVCDCTHYCNSPLTFVPWYTALHRALPALL